ncbi:MAG: hypothetical protein ACERKD_10245 [Prolixibacteraceae bacterium]
MKKFLKIVLFFLSSNNLFGTAQIPDLIIYNGDTLSLYSCPLNSFSNQDLITPQILFGSSGCFYTACWRNYVATWEIIDKELYLVEIRNACYPTTMTGVNVSFKAGNDNDSIGNEYADLKVLFPQRFKNGKVKADWVEGKLISPQGKLLYYFHDGFESIYETELEFTLEKGSLLERKILDNSKTKQSKYSTDQKLLKEFIANNIERKNLPKSDTIIRRVYVQIISSDENGKIDSVNIARGVNGLYDNEAIRVVKSIPEWDVIYRHGEKINQEWTLPIIFDLTDDEIN